MGMNNGSASTTNLTPSSVKSVADRWITAAEMFGGYNVTAAGTASRRLSREDIEAIADAVVARLDSPLRVTRAEMVALQRRGPIKAGG